MTILCCALTSLPAVTLILHYDRFAALRKILEKLDKEFCRCPFGEGFELYMTAELAFSFLKGPAGERVGYRSPGTCLDFVYETGRVPFAYAFEVQNTRLHMYG